MIFTLILMQAHTEIEMPCTSCDVVFSETRIAN